MNTAHEILRIQKKLEDLGVSPELSSSYAWQLLEYILHKNRTQLVLEGNINLSSVQEQTLEMILNRLKNNEPLQYIMGEVEFLGCTIRVQKPMLIPQLNGTF